MVGKVETKMVAVIIGAILLWVLMRCIEALARVQEVWGVNNNEND